MKIQHTTIKDYVSGLNVDKINYALRYGNFEPIDVFEIGELVNCEFSVVKDTQYIFNSNVTFDIYINLLVDTFNVNKNVLLRKHILELHQSRLYLRDQVIFINKLEGENLGHTPSGLEEAAGIDRFHVYGSDLQYTSLAGSDDYNKKQEVKKWPYSYCFMVLKKNKDTKEYQDDYQRLLNKK